MGIDRGAKINPDYFTEGFFPSIFPVQKYSA